jgi:predicted ATPase/class 3 adenylate cyclase
VATTTFLFTDIEGSTSFLSRVGEEAYAQVLAEHHALIRSGLTAHDGTELTMMGDGFFAAFTSPRECVAAVVAMQQAIDSHDWPAGERIRVRMGVHTGEAEQTVAGPVGMDVHRAARIAAVAHGGQVLLSETAATLVRDSLPDGTALTDLGVHRLRDLGRPERLFQLTGAGLQASFPPLRSLENPTMPNNLPAELSTFIGRDAELKEVGSLVESNRLVTLTGAGGSGKTRLALQAAAELLDGTGDGVWLVELAAVADPGAVPSSIASALGIGGQPGRPVLDTLADALAPQRPLIVLDNCEHLIEACAATADAVLRRCPRVHLLVTSREPLGIGGETIYRVPSMSLPAEDDAASSAMPGEWLEPTEPSDAVALFVDRAGKQGVGLVFDRHTGPLMASICRRLDGMPLAIELAAARLRVLSLQDLRDRLDHRFRLLTGGSRAALPRQQTLLATVGWSYSLLEEDEQRLLRRLAVFGESFDLAAAEAVCAFGGVDPLGVLDLLGSLVNKSLVLTEHSPDALRYRLLETIRQFAEERLVEAGGDEAATVKVAHFEHFLSVAEEASAHLTGPDQGRWYARLDADRANLRRAAQHAASSAGSTRQALHFIGVLDRYWMSRGGGEEGNALLRSLLERPDARTDLSVYVGAAIMGIGAWREVSVQAALRFAPEIIELARQVGEPAPLVEALSVYCGLFYFAGEPERGNPFGAEAVEIARQTGDDVVLATSIMAYLLCRDQTNPEDAERLYAEAIACTQRAGDRLIAYTLHNNASVHALRAGDFAAARFHLQQSEQAKAEIGEQSHHVAVNMGWVLRHEHDQEAARSSFESALRASRRMGEKAGFAYGILGLACVAGDLADWDRAAELHGAAQALLDQMGEPWQDPEGRYRQESIDAIRARIGTERFETGYAEGTALTFDDAYALALGPVVQAAA